MDGQNEPRDPRGVHDGEAEGRVQSPSHHLTDPGPSSGADEGAPLQDPAGNPATGAAEDRSGHHPSRRTEGGRA